MSFQFPLSNAQIRFALVAPRRRRSEARLPPIDPIIKAAWTSPKDIVAALRDEGIWFKVDWVERRRGHMKHSALYEETGYRIQLLQQLENRRFEVNGRRDEQQKESSRKRKR
ncbi:hypothetical protein C8J56DRAFT_897182 [Mycena floridula]|nr:hypothetical protein C8J56DRAFT_897182 [Mycena floridula]